jgi:hypothetical protein
MSKIKGSIYLLYAAIILGFTLASCGSSTPVTAAIGGIVQGAVYGDLNGNGAIDPGEVVLSGVTVILSDCGPTQTQVSAADGLFNFSNLPAGTCHVSVAKTNWIFSGSYPSLSYPVPVASNPALPTFFDLFMAPIAGANPSDTPTLPGPTYTPTLPGPTYTPTMVISPTSATPMVTPKTDAANCRFGPEVGFLAVGGLNLGNTVPIHGTIGDMSWWQIENPQDPGTFCWVSAAVTNTFGDLSLVPIVSMPTARVTSVVVTTPLVVHGFCGGPNATNFTVVITTNGPVTVKWHFEIYTSGGTLLNSTTDQPMIFTASGSQTFVSDAYKRDCGSYVVKAVTTSPNAMTGQASWTVVQP